MSIRDWFKRKVVERETLAEREARTSREIDDLMRHLDYDRGLRGSTPDPEALVLGDDPQPKAPRRRASRRLRTEPTIPGTPEVITVNSRDLTPGLVAEAGRRALAKLNEAIASGRTFGVIVGEGPGVVTLTGMLTVGELKLAYEAAKETGEDE